MFERSWEGLLSFVGHYEKAAEYPRKVRKGAELEVMDNSFNIQFATPEV
jgi:hypothetical protein